MTRAEIRVGPEQWPAAIADSDGHQLIVAGPGTGKTEFLVRRVTHILESGKARPAEVVVLCFSRRAAATLQRKIKGSAGQLGAQVDVTTFHSLARRIAEKIGVDRRLLTTPEQVGLVSELLADEDPADWPVTYRGILATSPFAAEVADFVMRCSERLLTPDSLTGLATRRSDWRGLPTFYARYLSRLDASGRTDYGVLLADITRALLSQPKEKLGDPHRYVLVDEYQDTTPAQAEIARLLAEEHGNLTVAGDPYQSIYSFRGAELRNIADFTVTHPDARRIVFTRSLRVPAEILESALRVVAGGDLPGAAGPVEPAPHPGRMEAFVFDQETAEAEWIAAEVERLIVLEGFHPSQIAVLVRSKRESLSELSRALDRRGVPHDPPENRLIDHPAVQMVRDLVTVTLDGGALPLASGVAAADADRAIRRVLLGPLFAMPLSRERALHRARRRTWEPWSRVITERLPELPGLAQLLAETGWAEDMAAVDGFWHLWGTLDQLDLVVEDPDRIGWRRALAAFSQSLSRQADRDPQMTLAAYFALTEDEDFEAEPMLTFNLQDDRVTLTTLHQAKGLEFEAVFIANASEGVFPDLKRGRRMLRPELLSPERFADTNAIHVFQLQEEMRLAYTAMTRARSRLVMTATDAGVDQGERRPSRFLIAAAGVGLDQLGPPLESEKDPVTVTEAETMMRRWLLDPGSAAVRRLAAATVLAMSQPWWEAGRFAGAAAAGPDRPILGEGLRLSPSQADAYQTCPRQYVLERRLRLSDSGSQYSMFGSLIHTTLERAESEVIGTGRHHADVGRALEHLELVWSESADFGTDELNEAWRRKGVDLVIKLYGNWPGRGEPVAVERQVSTTIGDVTWTGVIDRLERGEDGLRVIDYKTSGKAPGLEDVASSIQLGFYAAALMDEGEEVAAAELWFPRVKSKAVTTRSFRVHTLDQVREEMVRVTRSIVAEDWSPRPGAHCERCVFRLSCPAWPEGQGAYLS
jgi:superfamily I DNA/RNA helicase/RecB family exonuclease